MPKYWLKAISDSHKNQRMKSKVKGRNTFFITVIVAPIDILLDLMITYNM